MCRSRYQRLVCGSFAALLLLVALPQAQAGITFQANYLDGANEGFNDTSVYGGSTLGAVRRNAFEFAMNIWGSALAPSYAGETITIDASFDGLGGTSTSATLAQAGTNRHWDLNDTNPLLYADALANHNVGYDILVGTSEGNAIFNSDVDGSTVLGTKTWYYGTDNNAGANQIDFVSTALHEIGHTIGFQGLIAQDGSYTGSITGGAFSEYFSQYDYFVVRTSDQSILRNLSQTDRATAITNNDISWGGAQAIAANGGTLPKLYAPSTWASGSSYSHLDETTFALELMSPLYTDGTTHEISALTMGMMVDMGWTSAVPEPGTLAVWSVLAITTSLVRRRRRD